ncbi:hypothetical protein AC578_5686 [Pseudocercospora eumusae]|uniref:Uncharacterized protein n=1 Tax=Pseudocercospora eumusae TaxID=321146 RepID=A0A139H3F8_9PEZI|nr:hypothetical protein AC578_5686 [Pseudocercospora eumusae]
MLHEAVLSSSPRHFVMRVEAIAETIRAGVLEDVSMKMESLVIREAVGTKMTATELRAKATSIFREASVLMESELAMGVNIGKHNKDLSAQWYEKMSVVTKDLSEARKECQDSVREANKGYKIPSPKNGE